jgi:hypothetical protein
MDATRRPALDLFLVSGLVLFLELALIRWLPAHVLYLTFFTNAVLLAAFVGMSVGCLAARRPGRLVRRTPAWLAAALAAGLAVGRLRSRLETYVEVGNQKSPEVVFFGAEANALKQLEFAVPVELVGGVFFFLAAMVLVGPGQELGRAFTRVPGRPLAYSLNLLGSLAGILLFAGCSFLQLPPVAWFAAAAIGLGYFILRPDPDAPSGRPLVPLALLALAVSLSVWTSGVVRPAGVRTYWSPYYRVDHAVPTRYVSANLIGHQVMAPRGEPTATPYALPYLFRRDVPAPGGGPAWPPFRRVLVIGAGTGNDVARACQFCPPDARIDAVEIDPVIHRIGAEHHPDRPYQDPRVTAHLNDGRNFLRTAPGGEYDLVVFALVDSLVLQSGYSNLRLESYLFTTQSFADVRRVLKPSGVCAVYNFFRQGWIVARLRDALRGAFGADPVVLTVPPRGAVALADFDRGFTVMFAGAGGVVDPLREAFEKNGHGYWYPLYTGVPADVASRFGPAPPPPLPPSATPVEVGGAVMPPAWGRLRVAAVEASGPDLPPATDDWPFLYVRRPGIPSQTWAAAGVMLVLSVAVWAMFRGPAGEGGRPEYGLLLRSCLLGAGFMLVETKAVVHMALLFGGTWTVNTVVFAAVLLMSLAGNLFAAWARPRHLGPYYAGLFAALGLNLAVPLDAFLGLDPVLQVAAASALAFAPIAFAGVIFATTFARSRDPDRAFGANVAGALVGGLAENASMLLGFRWLLLVAVGFYLLSAAGGGRGRAGDAG